MLLLMLLVAFATVAFGQAARPLAPPMRTLTTSREAHSLPAEEARRAYPIHLKAVVTYYDQFLDAKRPVLFVHDSTGGIFVGLSSPYASDLHAGSYVDVMGVSAAGDFAPIVDKASMHVIGEAPLPPDAPRVSMGQLLSGKYDGQWVEIEGVVRSFQEDGKSIFLQIAMVDGEMSATTLREPGADYSRLIDSDVRIRGNAGPAFNRKMQMTGMHILFPGLAVLKIVEPGVVDPFTLPVLQIQRLLSYTPDIAFRHRVHVRGPVTAQRPGRSLCIQNGNEGLCVQTLQSDAVEMGEVVDVTGFPAVGGYAPILTDAIYRATGERQEVAAPLITAEQALHGDYDAQLVQVEGMVIGADRRAKDPTVVLSSGKFIFPVLLSQSWAQGDMPKWHEGSILRVTGVCSVQVDTGGATRGGLSTPVLFEMLMRSQQDVVVIHNASWWTAAHLLPILALLLAVTLCVLGWVVALRHRINEQTVVIRKQNVTLEGLSFQDQLTGVANRRKFDQVMEVEFVRAIEMSTWISLLMIDIDHFKGLNDTFGHPFGDECIARVAKELASASLRTTDLLARYGGDEFAVIMPACDEAGAAICGERLRMAVRGLSMMHLGSPIDRRLSISVGAASVVPAVGATSATLIALADRALYEFKQRRNGGTTGRVAPDALPLTNP